MSGPWANSTYFPDKDEAPAKLPAGFIGVLKRQQWKGVVDFSKAADAKIVIPSPPPWERAMTREFGLLSRQNG